MIIARGAVDRPLPLQAGLASKCILQSTFCNLKTRISYASKN